MNRRLASFSVIMMTLSLSDCLFSAAGQQSLSHWWQSAKFKAGFVLPFYKNRYNSKIYYIFGQEKGGRDKGTYSPFGGKADQGENHPVITAAREAYEEMNSAKTMNMSQQRMQAYIDIKNQNTHAVIAVKKSKVHAMVMYVVDFGHGKMQNQFLLSFCGSPEIGNVAEVREDKLKKALQKTKKGKPIRVEATVWAQGHRLGNQIITLRPITIELRKWFQGNQGHMGKDPRIHFYY